jgi:hypothetical protein
MATVFAVDECVVYPKPGVRVVLHVDEPWPSDDPFVKAHPEFFSETQRDPRGTVDAPVETATKRPGEKRTTRRR